MFTFLSNGGVLYVATALFVDVCIFGVLCVFQLHPVHWNSEAFLELLPLWLFYLLIV